MYLVILCLTSVTNQRALLALVANMVVVVATLAERLYD